MLSNYPFFLLCHKFHYDEDDIWTQIRRLSRVPEHSPIKLSDEDRGIIEGVAKRGATITDCFYNFYNYVTNQYVNLDFDGSIKVHGKLHVKPFLHKRSLMITAKYFNRKTQQTVEFENVEVKMPTKIYISIKNGVTNILSEHIYHDEPIQHFLQDRLISIFNQYTKNLNGICVTPDKLTESILKSIESRIIPVNTISHEAYTETTIPLSVDRHMLTVKLLDYEAMTGNPVLTHDLIDNVLYTYAKKKNAKGVDTKDLTLKSDDEYYTEAIKMISVIMFKYDDADNQTLNEYNRELTFGDCEKITQLLYILSEQQYVPDEKFFTLSKRSETFID